MTTEKSLKIAQKFHCEICNYNTSKKFDFDKHLLTKKHKNNQILQDTTEKSQKVAKKHICECGREYLHHSSLYKHKKTCKKNQLIIPDDNMDYKKMFLELVKQNNEMREMMIQQQKSITELIPKIGTNNINSNNKNKFNINLFLNEKCKDALTIDQFVNKIEVSLQNLLLTKQKGVNEGVSNILLENINRLSLYERPIYCTDKKRETMYINSNEGWHKDDNNDEIKATIQKVNYLQHKNINKWVEEHPGWEHNIQLQKEYMELVKSCTDDIDQSKVIKRISEPLAPINDPDNDSLSL